MDVHQRIAGVLLAVIGAGTLLSSLVYVAMTLGLHMQSLHYTVLGDGGWWLALLAGLLLSLQAWACAALRAGYCLYRGQRSRTVLPVAVLALLGFPLATAAGVYTLWSVWRPGAPVAPPDWQRIARQQPGWQAQA